MTRRRGLTDDQILEELRLLDEEKSECDTDISASDSESDEELILNSSAASSGEEECHSSGKESENDAASGGNEGIRSTGNCQGKKPHIGLRGQKRKRSRGRGRGRGITRSPSPMDVGVDARAGGSADQVAVATKGSGRSGRNALLPVGHEEKSKDGTSWRIIKIGSNTGRRSAQNILREQPGPTSYAKRRVDDDDPLSAWRLLFSEKMIRLIKECTEKEARKVLKDDTWSVSVEELDAVFAILYMRGVQGAKNRPLEELWSSKYGIPFCAQTMARDRFKEILRFMRFDDKSTRSERLKDDKFALASGIWDPFVENSLACYKPGENLTIDEQLLPCKARCPFTQYIASKPDKFGIKFWLLVDVSSKYVVKGYPYTGADPERPQNQTAGEHIVLKLMKEQLGTGRNVTTDSFFTSVRLATTLKKKNTSFVGTLNRQRREVPPSVRNCNRELYSTMLFQKEDDGTTLTVYQGKVNKNVLLLSTLHPSVDVNADAVKKTPDSIQFYNETKYGVDVVDQMSRLYTTKSGSRRWPMHVLSNILDLSAINAWVLYKEITNRRISRRRFIVDVAEGLAATYAASRIARQTPLPEESAAVPRGSRKKCRIRSDCNGNHCSDVCSKCGKQMCGKCMARKIMCCRKCVQVG